MLSKKTVFVLNAVAVHLPPALFYCLPKYSILDDGIAYSLSIPFTSTLVFGSVMKHQDAPGTTYKRHMAIARGLMSEDDFLLTEILFNPHTVEQIGKIQDKLETLKEIVARKDSNAMKEFLEQVRENLK